MRARSGASIPAPRPGRTGRAQARAVDPGREEVDGGRERLALVPAGERDAPVPPPGGVGAGLYGILVLAVIAILLLFILPLVGAEVDRPLERSG